MDPTDPDDAPPDPHWNPDPEFPDLDPARAADFRRAVANSLARRGVNPTQPVGRVIDYENGQLFLDRLSSVVATCPSPEVMETMVDEHIDRILAAQRPTGPRDPVSVLPRLRARLASDQLADDTSVRPLEYPWADGVSLVLSIDEPTVIDTPDVGELEPFGAPEELMRRGIENTRAELLAAEVELIPLAEDSPAMAVGADCAYLPSAPLFFPELFTRWTGRPAELGVIFALPATEAVLIGEVLPGPPLIDVVNRIATGAAGLHGQLPHPLSPYTYLWRDGEVSTIAGPGPEGLQVTPGAYLESLLR